jgi:hypothetical protein
MAESLKVEYYAGEFAKLSRSKVRKIQENVYVLSSVKTDFLAGHLGRRCAVVKLFGTEIGLIRQRTDVG